MFELLRNALGKSPKSQQTSTSLRCNSCFTTMHKYSLLTTTTTTTTDERGHNHYSGVRATNAAIPSVSIQKTRNMQFSWPLLFRGLRLRFSSLRRLAIKTCTLHIESR